MKATKLRQLQGWDIVVQRNYSIHLFLLTYIILTIIMFRNLIISKKLIDCSGKIKYKTTPLLIEYCFHSHMQKLCILACKFNGMIKTTNIKVPHYFFSAIFVLLFYCLPSSGLLAQVKHIGIQKTRNYSRHDYSGGTQNWGIAQDHLGKMYFANNMGLLEYDGTNWKRYPLNNRSVVRSVASNGHNIIYFGGYNEIGYLSVSETGKEVYTNLTPKVPKEYNNFGEIWRIHLTNYGVIFQSFSTVMLYHNGTIKVLANDYDFQFSFYIDNQLYLSDKKKGLLKFTGKEFIQLSGGDFFKAEKKIWSMFSFGKNNFLIGTQDDGLFLYHKEKTTPWKSEANSFLKKISFLAPLNYRKTTLLLAPFRMALSLPTGKEKFFNISMKTQALLTTLF